jgi:hypothetical protein
VMKTKNRNRLKKKTCAMRRAVRAFMVRPAPL